MGEFVSGLRERHPGVQAEHAHCKGGNALRWFVAISVAQQCKLAVYMKEKQRKRTGLVFAQNLV